MAPRITSREGASAAVRGFSVFGSAPTETTSRPPRFPSSPGRVSSSSDGLACRGMPVAGLERTAALARSKPQASNLSKLENLAILTIRPRQSCSLSSPRQCPAAMRWQALGILERTAQLPMRARTSTRKKPRHCIAEDLRGGCPNWAPAPAHPGPERKGSSPQARIAARGPPLGLKLRSKFPAKYDAEGDTSRWRRIPERRGRNRVLSRLERHRARDGPAAPSLPLQ